MNDEQPSNSLPIQLSAGKRVHVVHDGALTGEALELEARRFIWLEAIRRSIQMLRTATRASEWALHTGPSWNPMDQAFPTPGDGLFIAKGLNHMAVITFLTLFNSGWGDKGNVAGNSSSSVKKFRDECVQQAFHEATDRAAFDALLERLGQARDGLLAHADGRAQAMEHTENLMSFRPQDEGVTPEDLVSLLLCAEKLLAVVQATRAV